MTALGIVLALIPPALWVAWTESVLMMVVAVGAVSAALLIALAEFESRTAEDQQTRHGVRSREVLPDESIAEIHRIFPLTYHHSLNESARFRRAMDHVLRLTKRSNEREH
jgi:hypothetical protein